MQNPLTIVTYHYVRDLGRSRFPAICGLGANEFDEQIRYIKRHYNVIGGEELLDALAGSPLPNRSLLLTFDDGYIDHFTEVFPILDREGLTGCFFPAAKCVKENVVLDVNKIHFVLASVPDKRELVQRIREHIARRRHDYDLLPPEVYWERFATPCRFDPADVMFCKRLLQRELPYEFRRLMIDELFQQYVSEDEAAFSRELYMTQDQIALLKRHGMCIGSHGYEHLWLNAISPEHQAHEVANSLTFMESVGVDVERWIMCYPYGGHNESLHRLLRSYKCCAALTTETGLADLSKTDQFSLPRIDTNDLPKVADASPNTWTLKAQRADD